MLYSNWMTCCADCVRLVMYVKVTLFDTCCSIVSRALGLLSAPPTEGLTRMELTPNSFETRLLTVWLMTCPSTRLPAPAPRELLLVPPVAKLSCCVRPKASSAIMSSLDNGGSERYVVVSFSKVPCRPMVISKSRTAWSPQRRGWDRCGWDWQR